MISICLDNFLDDEHLYPSRSVRLSKKNASIGPENPSFVLKEKVYRIFCKEPFYDVLHVEGL